ncbi:hypothetical protein QLQ12_44260 [Actinoplanes sp. NEAU-A12]|uniref:LysM domain-containing protein n=1 Tax=Actinoplanes sandaracinus TaxID=3045177 RepID=A0ABT6X0S5_9ACTN|nr:hypothetical protein [Actinoplanes sandaracinus]MDI6105617.1 hypothetical protein [Actinoplanes sandaracinus]
MPNRALPSLSTLAVTALLGLSGVVAAGGLATPSPHPVAFAAEEKVKYYVVQTAYKGEPEFLYEIAERFLGNGERHPEIFELNKGRPQPDGRALTKPEEVEPGWILQLPEDAKGPEIVVGPLPEVSAPAKATSSPAGAATTAPAAQAAAPKPGTNLGLVLGLAGGGVVLAGTIAGGLVLLRRRRAAGSTAAEPGDGASRSPLPRAAAAAGLSRSKRSQPPVFLDRVDSAANWTVDRALRVVATACHEAGRPMPLLYAVMVDVDRMVLRLAVSDDRPPAPWSVAENGRAWESSLRDLQAAPVDLAVPLPALHLVTLGTADRTRVLLDLGQCHGLISLTGDKAATRALALMWAAELATNSWSAQSDVLAVGMGGAPATGGDRIRFLDGARAALDHISGSGVPSALFLAAPPSGRDAAVLKATIASPECGLAAVVIGSVPDARWTFTLHPDGRLDTGAVGIVVHAPLVTALT